MGEALMPRRGGVEKNGLAIEMAKYVPTSSDIIYTEDTVITSHTFSEEALSGDFFLVGRFPDMADIVFTAFDAPIEYSRDSRTYRVWVNLEGNIVRVYCRIIVGDRLSFRTTGIYYGFY